MTAPGSNSKPDTSTESSSGDIVQASDGRGCRSSELSFLNIKQSYLKALEALGYTESELAFSTLWPTHSG